VKQLREDIQFLASHNIMDYSLLISFSEEHSHLHNTVELKDGSYCTVGLIDYLQEYSIVKRMEGALKGIFRNQTELSSVDTQAYSKRLLDFVENKLLAETPPPVCS